jgi:peptidoglycan/LPS O-acetylase OafA/YrhL
MKKIWIKTLPGIAWFFIIIVLLSMPADNIPKDDWLDKIYADKIVHAGLFGLLTILVIWPIMSSNFTWYRLRKATIVAVVCVSVFGFLTELMQQYLVTGRSFDMFDWVADTVGAIASIPFLKKIYQWQNNRNQSRSSAQ